MVEAVDPFAKKVDSLECLTWRRGSLHAIAGPVTPLVGEQTMDILDEAATN